MNVNAAELTKQITAALQSLKDRTVPGVRRFRSEYSRQLRSSEPKVVRDIALALAESRPWGWRMIACELVAAHNGGLASLSARDVEALAADVDSWDSVDLFA